MEILICDQRFSVTSFRVRKAMALINNAGNIPARNCNLSQRGSVHFSFKSALFNFYFFWL
jgi:hypothetical protein